MQREIHPLDVDVVVLLQPFNTPGTEVAPRSDEVGEDFQSDWFAHDVNAIITVAAGMEAVNPERMLRINQMEAPLLSTGVRNYDDMLMRAIPLLVRRGGRDIKKMPRSHLIPRSHLSS